jgi:hypothetical protein
MKSLGLEDMVKRKKGMQRGKTRRNREGKPMAEATNFIGRAFMRATQRTVRFHSLAACPYLQRGSSGRFSGRPGRGMALLDSGLF